MRLNITGRQNIDPNQSYVIVVNHQSAFDIISIYGWLGIDFKWVMKQELRKVPVLGYACYRLGHIYVNRKSSAEAVRALQGAKSVLVDGTSVLFFPEGTRTQTSDLKPFKKGAFKMALDLGLPILPVTLKGMDAIMPTQTVDLFPGKAEMIFHEPISTEGMDDQHIAELIDQCREVMAAPLSE
jgi:1-acyl-sn-glycerol-3-phosphate acyltransferase